MNKPTFLLFLSIQFLLLLTSTIGLLLSTFYFTSIDYDQINSLINFIINNVNSSPYTSVVYGNPCKDNTSFLSIPHPGLPQICNCKGKDNQQVQFSGDCSGFETCVINKELLPFIMSSFKTNNNSCFIRQRNNKDYMTYNDYLNKSITYDEYKTQNKCNSTSTPYMIPCGKIDTYDNILCVDSRKESCPINKMTYEKEDDVYNDRSKKVKFINSYLVLTNKTEDSNNYIPVQFKGYFNDKVCAHPSEIYMEVDFYKYEQENYLKYQIPSCPGCRYTKTCSYINDSIDVNRNFIEFDYESLEDLYADNKLGIVYKLFPDYPDLRRKTKVTLGFSPFFGWNLTCFRNGLSPNLIQIENENFNFNVNLTKRISIFFGCSILISSIVLLTLFEKYKLLLYFLTSLMQLLLSTVSFSLLFDVLPSEISNFSHCCDRIVYHLLYEYVKIRDLNFFFFSGMVTVVYIVFFLGVLLFFVVVYSQVRVELYSNRMKKLK